MSDKGAVHDILGILIVCIFFLPMLISAVKCAMKD